MDKHEENLVENTGETRGKAEKDDFYRENAVKSHEIRAKSTFLSESEAKAIFGTAEIPPTPPVPEEAPPPTTEETEKTEPEMPVIPTKDAAIPGKTAKEIPEYTIIGELYASYVIMQLEDKVLIVDKHAAHERINFEILRAGMASLKPDSQMLIIPESLTLSAQEAVSAAEFAEEINACGFVFEIKDGKTVLISGVPSGFEVSGAKDMFYSLICELCEHGANIEFRRRSIFEAALYQTACKASIKAGRVYDEAMIRYVCDNLLRYDCIKYCPHGRPVAMEMKHRQLDKQFERC